MHKEKDSIASYLSRVVSGDQSTRQKTKVEVRIAGSTFTIIAKESEDYIQRVAQYVDHKITSVSNDSRLPLLDAAILTCCNIADEQFKSAENAEELRLQMKGYLDDIARLRSEISELRRELSKNGRE